MASQQSGGNGNQQFRLNETFTTEEYKTQIKTCLEGQHQNSLPFPHFVFTNFVSNSALIADLRKELQNVAWVKKCNDLYSLNQTVDLGDIQAAHYPMLSSFRHFMMTEVRQWLATATGVQLSEEKLAITGSRYSSGDCLLPHDDRLEGRAFAFVLYLTAGWEEADGGALCLYDSDPVKNHPTKVAKRIQPAENSLSLFRVQHNSWHSVEEVISEKQRLSLNGWFHYAENTTIPQLGPGPTPEEPFTRIKPTMDITLAEVNAWLNANYVKPGQHKQIKRIFAYKSELSLQQFLNADRYNEALAELETAEFEQCGPPNKRNVYQLNESKLAEGSVLRSLLRLFRSEAITLLLTQWTGLHLYDLNKKPTAVTGQEAKEGPEEGGPPPEKKTRKSDETPTAAAEGGIGPSETTKTSSSTAEHHKDVEIVSHIYRFERGCYSMADDQMAADAKNNGFCLDLMLFFGRRPEWPSQFGGFSSFFAIGENEEIMRVNPTMNTAAIVFREPEVLNFTKYVNHRAGADHFFVLNCSFFGISSGESESESSLESEEEEETPPEEEEEFDEEDEPAEGEDGNQQGKGNDGGQPKSTSAE